jgi:hypothetical protein
MFALVENKLSLLTADAMINLSYDFKLNVISHIKLFVSNISSSYTRILFLVKSLPKIGLLTKVFHNVLSEKKNKLEKRIKYVEDVRKILEALVRE